MKHLRNQETANRLFDGCRLKSICVTRFTSHTSHCRQHCTLKDLKSEIIVKKPRGEDLPEFQTIESQLNTDDKDFQVLFDGSDNDRLHHDTTQEIWERLASSLLQM